MSDVKIPILVVYEERKHRKLYQHGGLCFENEDGEMESWWDGSDGAMPSDEELRELVRLVEIGKRYAEAKGE